MLEDAASTSITSHGHGLCCTDQGCGCDINPTRSGSGGADVLPASKRQHAVQGTDGDGYLSRPTAIRARVRTIADHPSVASDCGLDPGALVMP